MPPHLFYPRQSPEQPKVSGRSVDWEEQREQDEKLLLAILELGPMLRRVLDDVYLWRKTYAQIADELGLKSKNSVARRVDVIREYILKEIQ